MPNRRIWGLIAELRAGQSSEIPRESESSLLLLSAKLPPRITHAKPRAENALASLYSSLSRILSFEVGVRGLSSATNSNPALETLMHCARLRTKSSVRMHLARRGRLLR